MTAEGAPLAYITGASSGIGQALALRYYRAGWRLALVAIAVLAAIITPSIDPMTMLLTMAPLVLLYLLSIVLARVGQRQYERSMAITV